VQGKEGGKGGKDLIAKEKQRRKIVREIWESEWDNSVHGQKENN
jgi:hypothetical protein